MSVDAIFAASRFGLEFERLRLEAATSNIAVANTPTAPGRPSQIMRAVVNYGDGFDTILGETDTAMQPSLVAINAPGREVHDASDPMADKNGMVTYPKVDLVQEMSTLTDAERAYEANVRAFNTLRGMALHSLDIGSGT